MRRTLATLVTLAAAATVGIGVLAAPVSGGDPPSASIDPTSGPVGTSYTVTGDQCGDYEGGWVPGSGQLQIEVDWNNDGDTSDPGEDFVGGTTNDSGIATASGTVPEGTAPGVYQIAVGCNFLLDGGDAFPYDPVSFTVTAPPVVTAAARFTG